jgi:ATP-dependent DNA helicase RecG
VEKTVEKILELIKINPQITQKQIAKATGLSRRGVEWNLKKLKDSGVINRIGADRGGYWEVKKTRS